VTLKPQAKKIIIRSTMVLLNMKNSRTKTHAPFTLLFRFGVSLLWLLIITSESDTCSAFSPQLRATSTSPNIELTIAPRFGCHHRYYDDSRESLHRLQASPDDSNANANAKGTTTKASVRFSGIDLDKDNTATNPVDYLLRLITSDVGSIVLGLSGVVVLLVGRSLLDNSIVDSLTATAGTKSSISAMQVESMGQETRSNLLAVFGCGAVLLNGISKLDITSVLAETVTLEGKELDKPFLVTTDKSSSLLESSSSVQWVLESLLTATPAKTAVLLQRKEGVWKILAMAGTVPEAWARAASAKDTPQLLPYMPIIERFQSGTNRESYLPTLQALPGRSEFTYLPDNTQAVLLIPVLTGDSKAATATSTTTVIALGADQARSFTPRNVAWSQAVATKLAAEMEQSSS
jgi:hypothetical protein